jgi:hypothetical protein
MRGLPQFLFLVVLLSSCSKQNSNVPAPIAVSKSASATVGIAPETVPVMNPQGVVGLWSVGFGDNGHTMLVASSGKGFSLGMAGGYVPFTWTYDANAKILKIQPDETTARSKFTLPYDPKQDVLREGGTAQRAFKRSALGTGKSDQQVYDEWLVAYQKQQTSAKQ